MHILITNDDGIHARGIAELAEAVRPFAQVTIVAPSDPRSGASNQITSNLPIRLIEVEQQIGLARYKCSGTPTDCVKLALNTLFKEEKPDLILSGINLGRNDGVCVFYSGTIGAALEGAIAGIPSIALSRDRHDDLGSFEHCKGFVERTLHWLAQNPLPATTLLSINFPHDGSKGVKFVRHATGRFVDEYVQSADASGTPVYWMQGEQIDPNQRTDTDLYWLEKGYTTITPLQLDLTDYQYLKGMEEAIQPLL